MLGAGLRQLAAGAGDVTPRRVDDRDIVFRLVPQVVRFGRRVFDVGPQGDRVLVVVLSLRDGGQPRVGVRRRRVGLDDLVEDSFRLRLLPQGQVGLAENRERTGQVL